MNLKKKLRKFFTLSPRANAGFTLVELIVVIAILAILAGIGVPAYSGYVTKANQQADMTLISEIEHALTLAGYNGTFDNGEGGYIILSADPDDAFTSAKAQDISKALDEALIATFGTGYSLTLKYDNWGNNRLYYGLADGGAESVYNSTYYGVSDVLMGQVKDITDAALSILDATETDNNRNDMIALFASEGEAAGTSSFLSSVAGMYGYVDENGYGDISLVNDDELPNLLVLAVACDITEARYNDEHQISKTSKLIQDFALYNGYAATEQGKAEGFNTAYDTFVKNLGSANGISDVAAAYKELSNTAKKEGSGYSAYASSQGQTDVEAFESMMTGLTSATADTNAALTKENLANVDFFTNGVGSTLFGTYIDSVESFAGIEFTDAATTEAFISAMAEEGVVGIFFTSFGSSITINNSLPVD